MPAAVDHRALLRKHTPALRFSALESYRPDAVEVMTEPFGEPGASPNWLKRKDGHVIAATHPTGDQAQLAIGFLRRGRYANKQPVSASDYLDIGGRDYVADARIRHANPDYANRAYGRVVTDAGGTWLQYWLYYFYNSKSFVVGEHEGDWEMIQLRIGDDGKPVEATYSQHSSGERRPWRGMRTVGARPLVFVAVASHACYFEPGRFRFQRVFLDHALGDGESVVPTLVDITDGDATWTEWPGRWGSTSSLIGGVGASPQSPCRQVTRWKTPSKYHAAAMERVPAPRAPRAPVPEPPAPTIAVRRDRDGIAVRYSVKRPTGDETEPVLLVVSVDPGPGAAPPATYSFPLERLRGTARPPAVLEDGRAYVIRAVTVDATGMLSSEVTADFTA